VVIIVISPFLVFIPAFGLLFIIAAVSFGFILAALGNKIWKEDVRHYRSLYRLPPYVPASKEKSDKITTLIGLFLLFFGLFLCSVIYFILPPRGSYAGFFPLLLMGIAMIPIGTALIFFGISSLERNKLLQYNIPEQHFFWVERERIRKKTIELSISLIFLYLIILLAFIAPHIIQYNEHWSDGHSGARSPFGSGGECCSLLLIIVFIVVFVIMRTAIIFKLKGDYIKAFEDFHKIK
jgi:hypothetical protein